MSRLKKGIPAEYKVRLVEKYLKGEISRTHASKVAKVEPGTITLLTRLYVADDLTALMDQKQNK